MGLASFESLRKAWSILLALFLLTRPVVLASSCSEADLQRSIAVARDLFETCLLEFPGSQAIGAQLLRHLQKSTVHDASSKSGPLVVTLAHTDDGRGLDPIIYGLNNTIFGGRRLLQIHGRDAKLASSEALRNHLSTCPWGLVVVKEVQELVIPEAYELHSLLDYVNMAPYKNAVYVLTLKVPEALAGRTDPAKAGQKVLEKWRSPDPKYFEKFDALMVRVFQYTFWADHRPESNLAETRQCVDKVLAETPAPVSPWNSISWPPSHQMMAGAGAALAVTSGLLFAHYMLSSGSPPQQTVPDDAYHVLPAQPEVPTVSRSSSEGTGATEQLAESPDDTNLVSRTESPKSSMSQKTGRQDLAEEAEEEVSKPTTRSRRRVTTAKISASEEIDVLHGRRIIEDVMTVTSKDRVVDAEGTPARVRGLRKGDRKKSVEPLVVRDSPRRPRTRSQGPEPEQT